MKVARQKNDFSEEITMASKSQSLEQKLEALENIISLLEKNELNLDENIKNFERGTKLYKECKLILNDAEKKVQNLTDSLKKEDI